MACHRPASQNQIGGSSAIEEALAFSYRQLIQPTEDEPAALIEISQPPFQIEAVRVLSNRGDSAADVLNLRELVDGLAPGERPEHLEAIRKAALGFQSHPVIGRLQHVGVSESAGDEVSIGYP